MRVAVDSDDAGTELKRVVVEHLRSLGAEVEDLDLLARRQTDYPDIGYNLAQRVAHHEFDRGVLICGTGLGMCMIANKVAGIYAGVCHDVYSAERLRKSNDAQIITMGARVIGRELAKSVSLGVDYLGIRSGRLGSEGGSHAGVGADRSRRRGEVAAGVILLGTSWKMNKTVVEAVDYARRLPQLLDGAGELAGIQLFVIPPFTAIEAVRRASGGCFWVGAQNMHWDDWGAFTGEISAPMLRELGVDLVELGHAERRRYFNETDETVGLKVRAALRHGIRPLVCVGEQRADRERGLEKETITGQLRSAFGGVPPECATRIMVAYEPVWAIGHGSVAAPAEDVCAMNMVIRTVLSDLFGCAGGSIPVLYGGTVDASNCAQILIEGRSNGLFIGRAALDVEQFARMVITCAASSPGTT